MHLLCCLHFFTATHQIGIEARNVAGIHNTAADALSRNMRKIFFDSTPQACREAAKVPTPLLDMSTPRLAVAHLEDTVSFFLGQVLAPTTMWVWAVQVSEILFGG